MKKLLLIAAVTFFLGLPATLNAQTWSAEQKEVWTAIATWWENSKAQNGQALIDMTHEDYKGWNWGDAFPSGKADLAYWATNQLANTKILHSQLKPLEILVNGNTAIAHYLFSETRKTGEETKSVSGRWTDIWIKSGNKWLLYADSGGNMDDED